ncbi:hypothetical protein C2G38_2222567 [Gigaspora rosea]|uniref:Uncharacterized protein n=1 Tax=Gigaspora rosea TaxID=44941 RepID=A0A397UB54_9GLOM|nr:hypothetical protein C2G38_2222566 [Gigaspora rosea]RIB04376.1 hypothetical protein C2G38_2222567 [Gigaspora rosea]
MSKKVQVTTLSRGRLIHVGVVGAITSAMSRCVIVLDSFINSEADLFMSYRRWYRVVIKFLEILDFQKREKRKRKTKLKKKEEEKRKNRRKGDDDNKWGKEKEKRKKKEKTSL